MRIPVISNRLIIKAILYKLLEIIRNKDICNVAAALS
jgi:hypothetical protein